VTYRERLWVPASWWILAMLLSLSALVAVGWYLGWVRGLAVGLVCLVVLGAIFVGSSIMITVDRRELTVGRARIELTYLAGVLPLDKPATDHRAGPGSDARAYLAVRPYIRESVEITLADSDDPVPYWLVSTRRPSQLAAALSAAISTREGLD
jgi:hypothetical protein